MEVLESVVIENSFKFKMEYLLQVLLQLHENHLCFNSFYHPQDKIRLLKISGLVYLKKEH